MKDRPLLDAPTSILISLIMVPETSKQVTGGVLGLTSIVSGTLTIGPMGAIVGLLN
ncbi:hypothetical protein [Bradyrhizobium sp. SRS-191]|uniref:hypothetical protein n=1 Tax=Bradyrhizobium sp. SRS-191 TaxID=2962606 RepID=UPI00211E12BE|nr:hypothetical protein [Bradyrhizobium sp. SRS-191]